MTKLRDRVALLNNLEWIFANYRAGRRRRTVVTLGARWPLLCPPFGLDIGKTWTSHGLNIVQLNFQVISAKTLKNFENPF